DRINYIGFRSLLIILLTGGFTGMVLGLQVYLTLVRFGSEAFLGPAVALSLIRELGPVLAALMVTGRAGSALTAEIGIMRITEQRAWPRSPPTRSSCRPCATWSGTTSWARCARERGRASRSRRRGESVIKVERLVKWFDGQQVLHEVDLEVATGSITVIIGRSGGGKTVLLRHLIGLLRPDGGRVLVDGVEVSRLRGRALDGVRRRYGVVFQGGALF